MKKAAAIILSLAMIFSLCSCGKAAEAPVTSAPEPTQTVQTPVTTTPAPAATETPAAEPVQEETKVPAGNADECMAAYKAFLSGNQKLAIGEDFACFATGESYLLSEFTDAFMEYTIEEWGNVDDCATYYSYFDCGLDGIPELALKLEMNDYDNYDVQTKFFILNCQDGTPTIVADYDHYYRSYSAITECGVVECGGSSGAASYYDEYTYIDAAGTKNFLYSISTEMANPKPAIPSWYLPQEIPDDYYDMWGDYDNDQYYTVSAFNFTEFDVDYDAADYDELFDIYCHDYFFTITDEEGEDIEPAAEYAELYKENNIKIVSRDEAMDMVYAHTEELGVTSEMLASSYIDFSRLDVEKINDEVVVNDDGSVTVGCTANLMENIKDGATIYLKPGVYNLTDWLDVYGGEYGYDNYARCRCYPYATNLTNNIFFYYGQAIINRINNLTIASLDPDDPAELIIDDEFNFVLMFCECSDLTLRDIVAGHSKGNEGHCSADVFEFNECDRVELYDCDLYGCGCYGIYAKDTVGLTVNGGRIHDCTYGMVEATDTSPMDFSGVVFENCDCEWGAMFDLVNCSADFYDCTFRNLGDMFSLDSSSAWVSACEMDKAAEESIKSNEKYDHGLYMWDY